jgi:hypothetical protein
MATIFPNCGNYATKCCQRKCTASSRAGAVGYNLRLVLAWLRIILRVILLALLQTFTQFGQHSNRPLNGRLD